ncbi:MAG: MASE1 domain-containing protein [Chloroflexota bacterium]|nr:MASE1 domain-containing protein [Chloroflexota bacterium]
MRAVRAALGYLPVQAALFALAYFAFARAGLMFAVEGEAITAVWPASGLFVGVLLVSARRRWPAFVAAAFVGDLAAGLLAGNGLLSFGIAAVGAFEALVAATVMLWVGGRPFTLRHVRQIVALALAGAGAATALTTLGGAALLSISSGEPFVHSWVLWWAADGIGILAVAPVICAAIATPLAAPTRRRLVETLPLLGGLAFCAFLVFSAQQGVLGTGAVLPPAASVPLLLWLAWRSGPLAAATGALLLCAIAALSTVGQRGPFAVANLDQGEQLLSLQLFLGVTVVTALGLAAAVTERRAAQLEELLRHNQAILNAAGEGIYSIDSDGVITLANPAAIRMTGHEPGELDGRHLHAEIHLSRPDGTPYPAAECPMLASLQDATVHRGDTDVCWRKDGTSFPVEYTSTPMVEDGQVKGAVVVVRDITERREVERAKDEFTSVVSHELRTPLTSIRGSLGLLQSGVLGPLPEQGQRMVTIAVQNTDRLVRLINDILDIERIDSGDIAMHEQLCDAAELIERAVQGIGQGAAEAQVRLIEDAQPAALLADPDRVFQILTNLISNAVKFSPPGANVRVSSVRRDHEVLFEVADEGRGIPADKLEAIFERFQQVDASDSREKGGTGLGLAICRTIVERHGGRIWVDSEPGVGSTFSFVLPTQASNGSAFADQVVDGPAILVCDDDPVILQVVGALLSEHGYRPLLASSGEETLRMASRELPDAILLDLLMPGLSGWDTAAALRADPATAAIPVVILSVLSPAETETPAGGVAGWINKPLDARSLFDTLEDALASRRGNVSRILVVEDDEDLAAVLCATFARQGVQTLHATRVARAVELARSQRPDLVVLDLILPDGSGFEVIEQLRQDDDLHAVPVVVYTAHELDQADRERLRLGETRYVMKGRITPAEFEQHVIGLLPTVTNDGEVTHHGP